MTELFSLDAYHSDRRSSKGNQLKFEKNHIWYKADYLGYEGLAEYVISRLLHYSTLQESEFVSYETDQILYNGQSFNACRSRDFTDGWQLITLERLFTQRYGKGMNQIVFSMENHTERLKTIVELTERATGLHAFGIYMAKMLTIDTLFLNEDRHAHNLAVLTKNLESFRLCPIFDNGAALLSDTMLEYPMNQDPIGMIPRVKPKTFCQDFDEQLDIAESLYGEQIHFHFAREHVTGILCQAVQYAPEVRQRVCDIIMSRRKKYGYLFREQG